jgi:hypothetical protein
VLRELSQTVTGHLGIPSGSCWLWWDQLPPGSYYRPEWAEPGRAPGPVGVVICRQSYSAELVSSLLWLLQLRLAELLNVAAEDVYLTVQRAVPGELLLRDRLWAGAEAWSGRDGAAAAG